MLPFRSATPTSVPLYPLPNITSSLTLHKADRIPAATSANDYKINWKEKIAPPPPPFSSPRAQGSLECLQIEDRVGRHLIIAFETEVGSAVIGLPLLRRCKFSFYYARTCVILELFFFMLMASNVPHPGTSTMGFDSGRGGK